MKQAHSLRPVHRGHHPFDYGEISGESEYESEPLVLKSWEEKLSMTYIRNDRRVRRRIVDDDVEFAPDLWESLDDGMLFNLPKAPVTSPITCCWRMWDVADLPFSTYALSRTSRFQPSATLDYTRCIQQRLDPK